MAGLAASGVSFPAFNQYNGINMSLPKISIVTPSYNQARFVVWTARSVFLQRYPNLEYILMDGGSKDGTMEALAPYADRFAYITSARDKGQADAVFRGFERCTGEIMAYLNSDDMLAPGCLDFVARFFAQHPDVDVVYSHRVTVDAANKAIWYWMLPAHSNYYMRRWDLIPQETCFWRRSMFERHGNVDPTFRFALDYDLFSRFMRDGKFVRVNRFLGVFRQHEEAKTSQLLLTVGKQEVEKVWKSNQLPGSQWHPMLSTRFFHGVKRRGWKFAASGKKLPGCLPGLGYDYDRVWGGLLGRTELAPTHV
jgi:glycosyltransferase involved in cell wall biosynthesis